MVCCVLQEVWCFVFGCEICVLAAEGGDGEEGTVSGLREGGGFAATSFFPVGSGWLIFQVGIWMAVFLSRTFFHGLFALLRRRRAQASGEVLQATGFKCRACKGGVRSMFGFQVPGYLGRCRGDLVLRCASDSGSYTMSRQMQCIQVPSLIYFSRQEGLPFFSFP